jgi:ABC transport system ATP-binding/permease protein
VIELVKEHAEVIELASGSKITASQFLTHFGFPYEKQHTFIRKLSGGERKRLQLLTVLVKNPNFLILDEPTNDLDLITLNTLEEFLLYFKGCLIIVSHDRYFMDKLADHLFVFQGEGKISGFPGSYSQYRLALEESKKEYQDSGSTKSEGTSQQIQPETQGKKRNYKEEKELAALDKEIKQLEEKKAELTLLMNQEGVSYDQVSVWGNQIRQTIELIESKTLRWLELSEME